MINRTARIFTLFLLVFLCLSAGVSAQEDIIDLKAAIPECTVVEELQISKILIDSNITVDYKAVMSGFSAANEGETLPATILTLSEIQQRWWSEVVPEFPNCAAANRLSLAFGRMLDESLIFSTTMLIFVKTKDADFVLEAQTHLDIFGEVGDQFDTIASQIASVSND